MGLETGNFISDLDESWPTGGDPLNKGDDHLRLVKDILKTQFPGAGGNGFAKAIIATENEINYLSGVTSSVQGQLDDHEARISANETAIANLIEAGTKMVFYQAAAPTGWTIDATVTDNMMRIVDGTTLLGGATGGTDDPVLNDKVPTHSHTASTSITGGGHEHQVRRWVNNAQIGGAYIVDGGAAPGGTFNTEGGGAHSHGASTTVNDNTGADWTPRFANVILATKD